MTQTHNTQGPWIVEEMQDNTLTITAMDGERSICDIIGIMKPDKANARLIAAAPMLLEALEAMRDALEKVDGSNPALAKAKASIAAATGAK